MDKDNLIDERNKLEARISILEEVVRTGEKFQESLEWVILHSPIPNSIERCAGARASYEGTKEILRRFDGGK